MKQVKYGVIGCGAIHGTHADSIKNIPDAELVGFYDIVGDKASKASEQFGGEAFATLESMFKSVDAVCICVPSGLHHQVTIEAAKAGCHVLSEKPIDVNVRAALSMVQACEDAGVKLGVISQHRMAPDIQLVRDRMQSGQLGKPLACDVYIKWYRTQEYYDSAGWRGTWELDGGGCLMNQGVHYIDMAQWVMGGIKSVQAMARTAAHERIEVEDICNALIEYSNGAIGVLHGSTSFYPGFSERLEVHGTWGTGVIEGDQLKVWAVDPIAAGQGKYGGGAMAQPAPNIELFGVDLKPVEGSAGPLENWGMQHRSQIEDFTQAILNDRPPFITGRDALQPLQVICAIYESAKRDGARVEVADMTPANDLV